MRLVTKRDVIPRKIMKNKRTIIREEITQGIPVLRFSFFIIGRNTKESMKDKTIGIITEETVWRRKPASIIARKRIR